MKKKKTMVQLEAMRKTRSRVRLRSAVFLDRKNTYNRQKEKRKIREEEGNTQN